MLVVGGDDRLRGEITAILTIRKAASGWNANRVFADVPELIDCIHSLPLFGCKSRSALLVELKNADVLTLHAIEGFFQNPSETRILEEVPCERNRRASGYTILTSGMAWADLKAHLPTSVVDSLKSTLAVPPESKLNCISLPKVKSL